MSFPSFEEPALLTSETNRRRSWRPSVHTSGLQTFVVLVEADPRDGVPSSGGTNPPAGLTAELIGLGLNCGSAVLAWSVVVGSGAAVPITGGASGAITVLSWGATLASSAQCLNSIVRSVDVAVNDGEWTNQLDSEDWYNWAGRILDGASLVGAGLSATATLRAVRAVRASSGRAWKEVLQGLNRAERKRLTKEIIRMQNANMSNAQLKALIRSGTFPARFGATQIQSALFRQLRDSISATLSFVGSAASGNVKALYVSIYQE
jgi:hypothetical protein